MRGLGDRHESGDQLVAVAYASNEAEAGLIQGLLENEGIPSILCARGIDGRQFGSGILASPPQSVMVRAHRAEQARALLAETLVASEEENWPEPVNARYLDEASGSKPRSYGIIGAYARIYLLSFAAMAVAFGLFVLLRAT